MAIGTDDAIWKFGTQDVVDDTSTSSVANNVFSVLADVITNWTNDDNALFGSAALELQFATMPTVGNIGLYARLMNITPGNLDENIPLTAGYAPNYVGTFPIDFNVANATNFVTTIQTFDMPGMELDQAIEWYIKNQETAQTISANWNLWITPKTPGPAA